MDKFWGGSILGLRKHRIGSGDITNHVAILTAYVEGPANEENDDDGWVCRYTAGFISGEIVPGEYEMEVDGPDVPTEEELIRNFLEQNGF